VRKRASNRRRIANNNVKQQQSRVSLVLARVAPETDLKVSSGNSLAADSKNVVDVDPRWYCQDSLEALPQPDDDLTTLDQCRVEVK
jgi:hypothetical protein